MKRTVSLMVSIAFFAIFGTLAIIVGIVDIMNPPYPYASKLPILGHTALSWHFISDSNKFTMEDEENRRIHWHTIIHHRLRD